MRFDVLEPGVITALQFYKGANRASNYWVDVVFDRVGQGTCLQVLCIPSSRIEVILMELLADLVVSS
jgi:hypothetical protein